MAFASRSYHSNTDRQAVLDLFAMARANAPHGRYNYLTHYRLDLLLTSRLWEPERDARIWRDGDTGRLVGFAMLWRRGREDARSGIEIVSYPGPSWHVIEDQALSMAVERMTQWARELSHAVTLSVVTGESEHARTDVLRWHDFTLIEDYPVRMAGALPSNAPHVPLPPDFALRRLDAVADPIAYATLYDQVFSPVSAEHRRELLRDHDYAHIVAIAPDGTPAAFCECSVSRAEWALGGRHEGEIDYLGTLQGFQRHGLGRALLYAAFQQLQEWGANEVSLVTGGANEQAQRVYSRAGMEIVDRARVYTLEITP